MTNNIVSREEWLSARMALLAKEKAFSKLRDQLSAERQALPWEKVDKNYIFEGPRGKQNLHDLFAGRSQLIVQHFMYGTAWDEGCPSCSFWADNFDGIDIHLAHRDVSFVAIAKAPYEKLAAYKKRMRWDFDFLSAADTDFGEDFNVSFSPEQVASGDTNYNYKEAGFNGEEAPGISVFCKDENGHIYHTYSCYGRGLDMLNGAYHYLDLVPKGRDEKDLPFTMSWLRRHDQY